ncbi:MAG: altronate dehydratase family protein [Synergistaceae bacterium]|jgi:altronate hydrolase|nr:altronate dehydratase family protein [Synergistaceae bacterium]
MAEGWTYDLKPGFYARIGTVQAYLGDDMDFDIREKSACFVRLNAADNVLTLPEGGMSGSFVSDFRLRDDIPPLHKTASEDIAPGGAVVRYGRGIALAAREIKKGEWVHSHNAVSFGLEAKTPEWRLPYPGARGSSKGTFMGYRRRGAIRPGVRSDLWVISSAACIREELRYILKNYHKPYWIDSVRLVEYPFGCEGDEAVSDVLTGLARNPNAAGVLFVGLGCENISASDLYSRAIEGDCRAMFTVLRKNSEDLTPRMLDDLASAVPRVREEFPLSRLCVGMVFSDGCAGISANPLLGLFADRLSSEGGSVLMPCSPEMFRFPGVIVGKMTKKSVYDEFSSLAGENGAAVSISSEDLGCGITTAEEKCAAALSCMGESPVTNIVRSGETPVSEPGIQLTPVCSGDPTSCTSLAAAGAQMILFAASLGTPFGSVVPTIKIAASSEEARKHPNWTDFDAGTVLEGEPVEDVCERLWAFVMAAARGGKVSHEMKGY